MPDELDEEFHQLIKRHGQYVYRCKKGHGYTTKSWQGKLIRSNRSKCGHPMRLVEFVLQFKNQKVYGIDDILDALKRAQKEGRDLRAILEEMEEG